MNIHPRAACGIYTFIGCLIILFFNKVVKIDINSPFYIVFIIIFLLLVFLSINTLPNDTKSPAMNQFIMTTHFRIILLKRKRLIKEENKYWNKYNGVCK